MAPGKRVVSGFSLIRALSLLLSSLACCSQALQFYLRAGHAQRRCFYDSAPPGTKILGEYTVAAGHGAMPIDIDVRNSDNIARYFYRQNIGHGKFAFVIPAEIGSVPDVEHAELKRKARQKREKSSGGRRRLLMDSAEDMHADDFDDDAWDMADYDGLDENKLEEAARAAGDRLQRDHDSNHPSHGDRLVGHDAFDDALMDDHDVDEVFAERRFVICVEARGGAGTQQRRVRLVMRKGESAQDLHRLAKKEHMTALELSLRSISSELRDLLRQLERAHQMEEALRAINQKTNKSVVTYSSISLILMFVFGFLQARYTKVYFKRKKIA
jgi:emp24/gp25L/p24 family/GOLD